MFDTDPVGFFFRWGGGGGVKAPETNVQQQSDGNLTR